MEKKKGYSMFERDKLDPADSMRIERNIYFEEQTADLSGLTALPLEQLQALREEYAAAEQAAFEALQEQAAAWDEQAGKTLAIDKAIEYVRTPEATHTANQWEATDYGKHISNRVYQMRYHSTKTLCNVLPAHLGIFHNIVQQRCGYGFIVHAIINQYLGNGAGVGDIWLSGFSKLSMVRARGKFEHTIYQIILIFRQGFL